jgi:predicted restriction endonuclease
MTITDKTRKVLWGRSGNRCSFCRSPLVIDATAADTEAVVGDECHVISGKRGGPRADSNFPPERIDELENLLLLCRVHHKMVDDQAETYTVDVLKAIRAARSGTSNQRKHSVPSRSRDFGRGALCGP